MDLSLVDDHSEAPAREEAEALTRTLGDEGIAVSFRSHAVNRGKGAALRSGFDTILESGPGPDDLVVIQDADLEYDPADFTRLMAPILAGEATVVIGNRWGHGDIDGHGLTRRVHRLGNRVLTVLSNAMTGVRLTDMECCYKLLGMDALRGVRPRLTESRFGIEPQLVAALARRGEQITEVAISYRPRGFGEGKKIGWRDGVRALYVIARERFRGRAPAASGHRS